MRGYGIAHLIDIDKSSDIDFNAHYKQTTSSQIISAKNESTLAESSEEEKNTKVSSPFNEQLNSAWNSEYGFYLENMIKVMMALGRFEIKKGSYFPAPNAPPCKCFFVNPIPPLYA